MDKPRTYCEAISTMEPGAKELHKAYHDSRYGFPIEEDDELFCRLVLEINQAGLSWTTILKKESNFREAYHGFNIKKVSAYTNSDFERLMNNPGIIRNRLKINAAIENARVIRGMKKEYGSFSKWLLANHPASREAWTKLFRKTFRFTGGEIVNEFLVSTGFLPGAHHDNCPVFKKVLKARPAWSSKKP